MAKNDITFYSSLGDGPSRKGFPVAASATFDEGDVVVVSSGSVDEAGNDPASVNGIAAMRSTDYNGDSLATGSAVTVYSGGDTDTFRSAKFATDGAGTTATPTQANAIGVLAGFTDDGTNWWVDTGTANLLVRITDVIDAAGNSVTNPITNPGTGVAVLFRFI